jgi:hypothetical protein
VLISIVVALLLPAISAARASSRRLQCQTNLRSIGQALLAFEAGRGRLPAGRNASNRADHSWATAVLPFMSETALYDRYDWGRPWNDEEEVETDEVAQSTTQTHHLAAVGATTEPVALKDCNYRVAQTEISVFKCPETDHTFAGAMDYGGNYGSALTGLTPGFSSGEAWDAGVMLATNMTYLERTRRAGVRLDEITDGASHTFMVLEDAGREAKRGGMWANGHNCFSSDWGRVNTRRANEIFSDHASVAYALLADGSVMELVEDTNRFVVGAMSTRSGNETINEGVESKVYLQGERCCGEPASTPTIQE